MTDPLLPYVTRILATLCVSIALAGMGWLYQAQLRAIGNKYLAWVNRNLKLIFSSLTPYRFATYHLGASLLGALCFATFTGPVGFSIALCGGLGLGLSVLTELRRRRFARLDAQIDPLLRSLAQSLRASPNLDEALECAAQQLGAPVAEEIALMLRQHRLGLPLELTIEQLAERTQSRNIQLAAAALVIGRRTGGRLPDILEELAATLRERMRLEAFIDAKTAEGKTQAVVIAIMPPLLGVAVYLLDRSFVEPLLSDPLGWAILGVIAGLIFTGSLLVRKLSSVEA